MSSKGQLVIPKGFRQRLGLKDGDFIGMVLVDDIIAIKKIEVSKKQMEKKARKAAKQEEFLFEELLYPEKKK